MNLIDFIRYYFSTPEYQLTAQDKWGMRMLILIGILIITSIGVGIYFLIDWIKRRK